jgi:hypothetical protein
MSDLVLIMAAPLVACLLLAAMFAYLGIHIIAREVIFVDLSLAQMAALGSTSGLPSAWRRTRRSGTLPWATTLGAAVFASRTSAAAASPRKRSSASCSSSRPPRPFSWRTAPRRAPS